MGKFLFSKQALRISPRDVFASEVFAPAFVTFLTYLAFGMILTLIPDWSEHLGIGYKGLFFIVFTFSSLLIRFIAGKLSDDYGRVPLIYSGLIVLLLALVVMASLQTIGGLIAAAIAYGLAMGILSPALNAWTIDLSRPERRGRAIATMFIGLEAGIGLGALLSGFYYQDTIPRIPQIMFACATTTLIAIIYTQLYPTRSQPLSSTPAKS